MHPFLRYATDKQAEIVALAKRMVECESPTNDPSAVNRMVDLLVEETRDLGRPKTIKSTRFGRHLLLEFGPLGTKKNFRVLGLGHTDTVWPIGTLSTMKCVERDGRLWGPGVLDMKAGLAFFIYAVRLLRELDIRVDRRVSLLVVSDEEVGSETSREWTEREAKLSSRVFVLEPGTGLGGKLKTARKGVGDYRITVTGRASHAGVDFGDGASAIVELAKQIEKVASFTNLERGTTVNPGVISGGTRSNVVAAEALVDVDVRVVRLKDAPALERKFKGLRPVDKRCRITVSGGLNRPPMERTREIAQLFTRAKAFGKEMGLTVEESSTGGGSDGNFTAALGIPTLDGLGGVGEGAHASTESILLNRVADRVALLARLIEQG